MDYAFELGTKPASVVMNTELVVITVISSVSEVLIADDEYA